MATSATNACKLAPTADPAVFKSAPGNLRLVLKPTSGNVTFIVKDTDVLDSSGKSVDPAKTATTLSFVVTAGQTYLVETEYLTFPTHSTGELREDCLGGLLLSPINAMTNPQQFTVQG